MKIAILVFNFPPKWLGGTEIATYNIAKHLSKRGHEVHVLTTLDKSLPRESKVEGFYVHRIKIPLKIPTIPILQSLLLGIKFTSVVSQINPDIIHLQGISATWIPFAKKFKKKYVVWGRGSDIYTSWTLKKVTSSIVIKNAGRVLALTQDMKNEMQKIYNSDDLGVIVIPNGIDLKRFENLPRKNIRESLGIEGNEKIVLFVGTLKPVKGVSYLIEAMNVVNNKAKLLLVGDGGERRNLETFVKKSDLQKYVNFVGKIPNDKVPEYMAASDVFVLPSLSEGFPVVVVEAMASGLPIIATDVGGLSEIVKDGENGFLVEPKNTNEIAEKILSLLEADMLRERISENNREKAREYGWVNIIEKLEKIYYEAIGSSR